MNSLKPIAVDPRAHYFFPSAEEQKTGSQKSGTRFFFYGQIKHDDYQKKKLEQFKQFLSKNSVKLDQTLWTDQKILQVLCGNAYKNQQALEAMKSHQEFRNQYLGLNLQKKSGFFYPCGRDKNFRPILVFNCKKMDLKDLDKSFKASIFVHQNVMKNMFLPGQVQSWNIIYDLGSMGITQIPTSSLKSMMQKMSSNYGGRLHRLWIVNAPFTISVSWKIVSAFLDQVTVDKIKISKSKEQKDMWKICDKSQVQQKYGGTQPNRTQQNFYPFQIPEGVFDETRLISQSQYKRKLQSGELSNNIIHPNFNK